MRYRVDDLAARAGTSVDTIRFYQARGLLPPPEREGRVAWYTEEHLDRLDRVRALKDNGLTLEAIRRLFAGELDVADAALAAAVAAPAEEDVDELITADELARRTGVSVALLEAIEREGILVPRVREGRSFYTAADAESIAAGVDLLQAGLPLGELLALAREHDRAMRDVAKRAVDMFARFVRDPIRAASETDEEAAARLVDAFNRMLPATIKLVSHHFRRVLLEEAEARIATEGDAGEIAAVQAESERRTGTR